MCSHWPNNLVISPCDIALNLVSWRTHSALSNSWYSIAPHTENEISNIFQRSSVGRALPALSDGYARTPSSFSTLSAWVEKGWSVIRFCLFAKTIQHVHTPNVSVPLTTQYSQIQLETIEDFSADVLKSKKVVLNKVWVFVNFLHGFNGLTNLQQ